MQDFKAISNFLQQIESMKTPKINKESKLSFSLYNNLTKSQRNIFICHISDKNLQMNLQALHGFQLI